MNTSVVSFGSTVTSTTIGISDIGSNQTTSPDPELVKSGSMNVTAANGAATMVAIPSVNTRSDSGSDTNAVQSINGVIPDRLGRLFLNFNEPLSIQKANPNTGNQQNNSVFVTISNSMLEDYCTQDEEEPEEEECPIRIFTENRNINMSESDDSPKIEEPSERDLLVCNVSNNVYTEIKFDSKSFINEEESKYIDCLLNIKYNGSQLQSKTIYKQFENYDNETICYKKNNINDGEDICPTYLDNYLAAVIFEVSDFELDQIKLIKFDGYCGDHSEVKYVNNKFLMGVYNNTQSIDEQGNLIDNLTPITFEVKVGKYPGKLENKEGDKYFAIYNLPIKIFTTSEYWLGVQLGSVKKRVKYNYRFTVYESATCTKWQQENDLTIYRLGCGEETFLQDPIS